MGDVAGGRVSGERGCHILLDAVSALHGLPGGRRHNIVRHQGHNAADI